MSDEQKPRNYRDLIVWQRGMGLAKALYKMTGHFPTDERFGLVSQIRRAAVSVPSNIAEGQARKSTAEFVQFISHAEGSLAELDTQILLSRELGYCAAVEFDSVTSGIVELRKMLNALRRKLVTRH